MRSGEQVVVEDVRESKIFAGQPSMDVLIEAGVFAVISTPLMASTGNLLGMVSTHFVKPHRPSERELRLTDLLARQTADYLERTALALKPGGYDWGALAYTVGFGGSMIWFGSSAGVALSNSYPEAKSVALWLRHGWHVTIAYVIGFAALNGHRRLAPHPPHKAGTTSGVEQIQSATSAL